MKKSIQTWLIVGSWVTGSTIRYLISPRSEKTRAYQERLQEKINQDREDHGKKIIPPEKFDKEEVNEIKESTTDPESGYYVKDERTKQFAYSFHSASDRNGFVVGTIVTPGNTHDSQILEPLVEKVIEKVEKPKAVAADAAYKTPAITRYLFKNKITPALPYTRPRTKEGFFRNMNMFTVNTLTVISAQQVNP